MTKAKLLSTLTTFSRSQHLYPGSHSPICVAYLTYSPTLPTLTSDLSKFLRFKVPICQENFRCERNDTTVPNFDGRRFSDYNWFEQWQPALSNVWPRHGHYSYLWPKLAESQP
ncbi:3674_t:CDS:2 [Acaulospora colombiana]|uniref:3674_t:CDS:1 n=1 Tax=Acaulospora colombiana TaxID=27376 RepID=A0ACA9KHX6_9GLOM|nr:3674_t:CDS:2 [Acaulospora colombiana]